MCLNLCLFQSGVAYLIKVLLFKKTCIPEIFETFGERVLFANDQELFAIYTWLLNHETKVCWWVQLHNESVINRVFMPEWLLSKKSIFEEKLDSCYWLMLKIRLKIRHSRLMLLRDLSILYIKRYMNVLYSSRVKVFL